MLSASDTACCVVWCDCGLASSDMAWLQAELQTGNLAPDEVARASKEITSEFPDGIRECGCDALRFTLTGIQTGT